MIWEVKFQRVNISHVSVRFEIVNLDPKKSICDAFPDALEAYPSSILIRQSEWLAQQEKAFP